MIDVGKFGGHGNPFRINQCGMKAYPAVVYTQTAIVGRHRGRRGGRRPR